MGRAATAAARGTADGRGRGTTERRSPRGAPPRRVSGPAGGVARRATAAPARETRPATRRLPASRPALRPHAPRPGLLDRLLRGRLWIALIGGLLAGIVFFNVSLLKLNEGIASTTEKAADLKRENARLRMRVARLGSSERIQRAATARGFFLPAPGEVRYLRAEPAADALRAARRISRGGPTGGAGTRPVAASPPPSVAPAPTGASAPGQAGAPGPPTPGPAAPTTAGGTTAPAPGSAGTSPSAATPPTAPGAADPLTGGAG